MQEPFPTTMSGAQAVMESLVHENVSTIFGYPGGAIMPVYDLLFDYEDRVHHILTRHEQGAIHAAQGYARASGKVGVVFATSGPGATNLITGIADAMIDSTPLVCITGQVASNLLGTDAFQETDIIGVSMPIVKWSYQITKVEDIPRIIAKAFYIASTGRPGPVLIDISKDAQFNELEFSYPKKTHIRSYCPAPKLNMRAVAAAADLLNRAKKPLLVIGQGVVLSGAEQAVMEFAEKSGIAVACTLLGLGAFPQTHAQYVGLVGMHGDYAPNIKTNECDVLITVGMRFDDRVTGNASKYAKQAQIIHIDIDAAEIGKTIPVNVGIHADAKEALRALTTLIAPQSHPRWLAEFARGKEIEIQELAKNKTDEPHKIHMEEAVTILSNMMGCGTSVVVTDVGIHQMMTARHLLCQESRTHITSGGLGTMGFALPAAIGAKLGVPEKTVIAVVGDGGFQMTLEELGVILQNKIDVKIMILNNSFLGMVRQWQDLFFDKRYAFTELVNPDFVTLAHAYGIESARVDERENLSEAISNMLSHKGAYLLEVVVAREENVFPMIPAGASVSEIQLCPQKK